MKKKCAPCPNFSSINRETLDKIHGDLQEIKTWVRLYALNQHRDCAPDLKGITQTLAKINGVLTLLLQYKNTEGKEQ